MNISKSGFLVFILTLSSIILCYGSVRFGESQEFSWGYLIVCFVAVFIGNVLFVRKGLHGESGRQSGTLNLLLVNVPLAIVFLILTFRAMSTYRIEILNSTEFEIQDLKIQGCLDEDIPSIKGGQNFNTTFQIRSDCELKLIYSSNGLAQEVLLVGYLTPGWFGSTKYVIQ